MSQSARGQNRQRLRGCIRVRAVGIVPFVLCIVLLPGCSRRRDPEAAYDHAFQTFQHGDMTTAGVEAEKGYQEFHGTSAGWGWKFTILRARVLYRRGMYEEVLKMLASEPGAPPFGEPAVRARWLEGLAYT